MIRSWRLRDGDYLVFSGGVNEYRGNWPYRNKNGQNYRFLAGNAVMLGRPDEFGRLRDAVIGIVYSDDGDGRVRIDEAPTPIFYRFADSDRSVQDEQWATAKSWAHFFTVFCQDWKNVQDAFARQGIGPMRALLDRLEEAEFQGADVPILAVTPQLLLSIIERAAKVGASDISVKGSKRKLGLLNEVMLENGGWVLMEGQWFQTRKS